LLLGLKKDAANPALEETLLPAQNDDVLELDEMWSFVLKKVNKCWLWIAICRRTRQVVAFVLGDRSESSCRLLWERIPMAYETCRTFSDFWSAYCKVFPKNLSHYSLHPHKTNSQAKKRIKTAGLPFPADNQAAEFSLHPRKSPFNLKSRRSHDDRPSASLFRILLSWNLRLNPSSQKKISHIFRYHILCLRQFF
jgi:IS1 family transposase